MESGRSKVELSVVMPVYNEEDIIANSINKTLEVLESANITYELIIVDDGSSDATTRMLGEFKDKTIVLSYPENRGKGYALRYGSSYANGGVVAFFDSDLNINPSHIVDYFLYMKTNNFDVVVGSKRMKKSVIRSSFERQFLSIVYHLFAKALLGLEVMDTQVGIKLFKKSVLIDVLPISTIEGFAIDVELLVLASRFGYKIAELPVSISIETQLSNIHFKSIENMFVDTLKILYKLRFARATKNRYQLPEGTTGSNLR